MPDSCSRRVDLVPPSRRCPSNEQHREQHRHLPVLRRSADLCERCTALVTELRVRRQFGAARPTEQPRRGQSTTIPAGVHVSIVSLLVNDVRHIAVPSPAPASRPRWSAQAASRSLRLPRRRPQPLLALPCQQGAGGRRVPQVQGGRAGQAPPMTKCAIESTSRSNRRIARSIGGSGLSPHTGGVAFVARRASQCRQSGARGGFRGFGRVLASSSTEWVSVDECQLRL